MPLSDSPSSLETLEALGNYLTDLQLAVDQVASTLRSLNAIAPAIPDAPKTLSRNLCSLATGADALALGISGLRWRATNPIAAKPARPDLVVEPVAPPALPRDVRDAVEAELQAADMCLPSIRPDMPRELSDALMGVREALHAAQRRLHAPATLEVRHG